MGRRVLSCTTRHVASSPASDSGADEASARSHTARQHALSGATAPSGMAYPWPAERFVPDSSGSAEEMLAQERVVIAENQAKGFAEAAAFSALTPEQRFEFDIRGYFVLKGHYSAEQVAAFNSGIDEVQAIPMTHENFVSLGPIWSVGPK